MSQDKGGSLCVTLRSIGLSQPLTSSILSTISQWERESGIEWTVARLKSIYTLYVRYLAGCKPSTNDWIKKGPDGIPKGPMGALFKQDSKKDICRALNALRIYTQYKSGDVSRKQWLKFSSTVTHYPSGASGRLAAPVSKQSTAFTELNVELSNGIEITPLVCSQIRTHKYTTDASGNPVKESNYKEVDYLLKPFETSHTMSMLLRYPQVSKSLPHVVRNHFQHVARDAEFGGSNVTNITNGLGVIPDSNPDIVGRIAFIQEPGFKLRAIAIPFKGLQTLSKDLGDKLFRVLSRTPEDCCYNQSKGITAAQNALCRGKTVYSYDLTAATDLFPYRYQRRVLQLSNTPEWMLKVCDAVSNGWYKLPTPVDGFNAIQYRTGQPMGWYPSFALFSICHHILVQTTAENNGVPRDDDGTYPYRILGDDIVIYDDILAEAYCSRMKSFGCKFSDEKTIISSKLAEFAGKVITLEGAVPTRKWRDVTNENFMEIIRVLGPSAKRMLTPLQRKVLDLYSDIPEPAGLGFNPKGLSLDDRLWKLPLLDKPPRPVRVTFQSNPCFSYSWLSSHGYNIMADPVELVHESHDLSNYDFSEITIGRDKVRVSGLGWDNYIVARGIAIDPYNFQSLEPMTQAESRRPGRLDNTINERLKVHEGTLEFSSEEVVEGVGNIPPIIRSKDPDPLASVENDLKLIDSVFGVPEDKQAEVSSLKDDIRKSRNKASSNQNQASTGVNPPKKRKPDTPSRKKSKDFEL